MQAEGIHNAFWGGCPIFGFLRLVQDELEITKSMRTFLRHATSGQYFRSLNTWTFDREEAHNFGLIARAMKVAKKLHLSSLELIVDFDDPNQIGDTPFDAFLRKVLHGRRQIQPLRR